MSRKVPAAAWLLLAALGCGPAPGGDAPEAAGERAAEGVGMGLRFEDLVPIPEAEVAPLETYPTRDGGRLPVRHYPLETASGPDTTLLLVHGSGYHGRYLAPLARALARAGAARTYTPDVRGHGLAPERRGDVDYVDQLEDDLADLVDHVEARHPGTRVVIGGHSSGGGLAVRFAGSRHGDRADAYLLLTPFLGHDAPTTRPDAGGWARPRVPAIVALAILNGFGVTAWNDTTAITFDMPESARDGSETLAYSYRLNTGYAPRGHAKDLAAVRVPLLGIIGSEDEAFLADRLEPTLTAHTDARVIVLEGVGHLDLPQAPGVADAIADWLASF